MKINERGVWEENGTSRHVSDTKLCNSIIKLFKNINIESVIDIGCGTGYYTKRLKEHFKCDGFDGNPYTEVITNMVCKVKDFTDICEFNIKYDAVLCLEVAEHIPKIYEHIIIGNIIDIQPKVIVISWAIPGQCGDGHVNEQPNEYVINIIEGNGYKYDNDVSQKLREESSIWWFKNTLMTFFKM